MTPKNVNGGALSLFFIYEELDLFSLFGNKPYHQKEGGQHNDKCISWYRLKDFLDPFRQINGCNPIPNCAYKNKDHQANDKMIGFDPFSNGPIDFISKNHEQCGNDRKRNTIEVSHGYICNGVHMYIPVDLWVNDFLPRYVFERVSCQTVTHGTSQT